MNANDFSKPLSEGATDPANQAGEGWERSSLGEADKPE